jgi:hypothetical protein
MCHKNQAKQARLRSVSVERVLKIVVNEGAGGDGDPITPVTSWYTWEGKLIGRDDPERREGYAGSFDKPVDDLTLFE